MNPPPQHTHTNPLCKGIEGLEEILTCDVGHEGRTKELKNSQISQKTGPVRDRTLISTRIRGFEIQRSKAGYGRKGPFFSFPIAFPSAS